MTPESFAFFLHTAIYSAVESYAAAKRLTADRRNMLATSIAEHVTSMDLKQQKIEKEIQKAKKHFTYQYGSNSDDLLDQTINELMEKAADEMISIDQPIVDLMKMIKSGINFNNSPNVDQSSKMEIVIDTPVMK
ncbi:unnamed protein product [Rhizophagus irregularis]|nr:unnamed protein product [Rhizophagus irregularis]